MCRLDGAVNAYGNCYPDCRIPNNMKMPVIFSEIKAKVSFGRVVLSCKPGTKLLSCGLEYVDYVDGPREFSDYR